MAIKTLSRIKHVDEQQTGNGAKAPLEALQPYVAEISIRGIAPFIFHKWDSEAVAEKAASAKGSKSKKSDNLESYVYRTEKGLLGCPTVNFRASLIEAGRWHQDPRSPRKALRDLLKAALVPETAVVPFAANTKTWDYEDKQRAVVQRSAITRVRPAMREGWELTFRMIVATPEYIPAELLGVLVTDAGRLVGLGDHRPSYGRFVMSGLDIA